MILVTGATGNIGRPVLLALVQAGESVRVLARDPARVEDHGPLVEVVVGDLDQPDTLPPALVGVDKVFLLAPGPNVPAQDAAMIDAAAAAGVRHLVMVSSLGAEVGGVGGGRAHMPGEALLKASTMDWTILHPSEFMTNTLWWAETIRMAGSIFVPTGSGRVGFIDPADIGQVAAAVLLGDGHEGRTYRLTGPESLSTADIAALIGQVRGEPVGHVDVSDEAFEQAMVQAGMPAGLIAMQVEYCAAVRAGRVDIVADGVSELLERPPGSYADWLAENAALFQ